jgi:hypothetical protein
MLDRFLSRSKGSIALGVFFIYRLQIISSSLKLQVGCNRMVLVDMSSVMCLLSIELEFLLNFHMTQQMSTGIHHHHTFYRLLCRHADVECILGRFQLPFCMSSCFSFIRLFPTTIKDALT